PPTAFTRPTFLIRVHMWLAGGTPRAPRATTPVGPLVAAGRDCSSYLSLMAALTLAATSGGMVVILCAAFACSAPFAITSASSFPSMTALHPGIKSPHLSTFAIASLLLDHGQPLTHRLPLTHGSFHGNRTVRSPVRVGLSSQVWARYRALSISACRRLDPPDPLP